MTALKACFEAQGFRDMVTYIESGNVLFTASESGSSKTRLLSLLKGPDK